MSSNFDQEFPGRHGLCLIRMIARNRMARQISYTDDFKAQRSLCRNQSVLFYGHLRNSLVMNCNEKTK